MKISVLIICFVFLFCWESGAKDLYIEGTKYITRQFEPHEYQDREESLSRLLSMREHRDQMELTGKKNGRYERLQGEEASILLDKYLENIQTMKTEGVEFEVRFWGKIRMDEQGFPVKGLLWSEKKGINLLPHAVDEPLVENKHPMYVEFDVSKDHFFYTDSKDFGDTLFIRPLNRLTELPCMQTLFMHLNLSEEYGLNPTETIQVDGRQQEMMLAAFDSMVVYDERDGRKVPAYWHLFPDDDERFQVWNYSYETDLPLGLPSSGNHVRKYRSLTEHFETVEITQFEESELKIPTDITANAKVVDFRKNKWD